MVDTDELSEVLQPWLTIYVVDVFILGAVSVSLVVSATGGSS